MHLATFFVFKNILLVLVQIGLAGSKSNDLKMSEYQGENPKFSNLEIQWRQIIKQQSKRETKDYLEQFLLMIQNSRYKTTQRQLHCRLLRPGNDRLLLGDTMGQNLYRAKSSLIPTKGKCRWLCFDSIASSPCIGLAPRKDTILSIWKID